MVANKRLTLAILLLAFTAHSGDSTITYANQTYKTAKIGTQTWLAENLNYKTEGSKCFGYDSDRCAKSGRLYNWETAMKVCPEGWHLPSNAEWDKLLRFVDGDKGTESPYRSKTAGKYLKAASGWDKDGNGTDKYGFSALPGGVGFFVGDRFLNADSDGLWWSASEYISGVAYVQGMGSNFEGVNWGYSYKFDLLSVRCLQD